MLHCLRDISAESSLRRYNQSASARCADDSATVMLHRATRVPVLHLVPPNGGGVDRYVRDALTHFADHALLHVSQEQWVFEQAGQLHALRPEQAASWVQQRFGLLHAHSVLPEARHAVETLAGPAPLPYVLTLHDIQFAQAPAEVGEAEAMARRAFVRRAAARVAPSTYVQSLAHQMLGADLPVQIIVNGTDCPALVGQARAPHPCDVAVIGALGQSKGLDVLDALASRLPAGLRVVVLGYTPDNLVQGWRRPDKVWVHGPFEPEALPALVAAYGCRVALFPGTVPESHCYALSDAWCAGLPALVPDVGALADRTRATGAGWIYPLHESAQLLAKRLIASLGQAGLIHPAVTRARRQLPTVAGMAAALRQVYASVPSGGVGLVAKNSEPTETAPAEPENAGLAPLAHLHSRFFRKELLRLAGDLAHTQSQLTQAHAEIRQLAQQHAERGEWIDKQQRDFDELRAALVDRSSQAEQLQTENLELNTENRDLKTELTLLRVHQGVTSRWVSTVMPALRYLKALLRPAWHWLKRRTKGRTGS